MARNLLALLLLLVASPAFAQDTAQFFKGTFTAQSGTGDQTISGIVDDDGNSFTPKAILIWGTQQASAAVTDTMFWNFGFSDCTNDFQIWSGSQDNVATSDANRVNRNDAVISTNTTAASNLSRATVGSCGGGQFVLNWSVADASGMLFHYVAIGGSDVSAFAQNQRNTTPVADTSGFLATAMILQNTVSSTEVGSGADARATGLGFVARQAATYQQGTAATCLDDNAAVALDRRVQLTASASILINGGCPSIGMQWQYQGNFGLLTVSDQTIYVPTLLMTGLEAFVASGLQATSATTQVISGLAFEPKLVLMFSVGNTASAAIANEARFSFGAATPDGQGHVWYGELNGSDPMANARKYATSSIVSMGTPNATGSSSTFEAIADISAWSSDGFTINWSVADATQREYIWMAFGPVTPTPPAATPSSYVF